jgi:hypothetical protein
MNKLTSIFIIGIIMLSGLMPLMSVKATPTYYGNFSNSQLLESVGTVRKWVVKNQTILYNNTYTDHVNYNPYLNLIITNYKYIKIIINATDITNSRYVLLTSLYSNYYEITYKRVLGVHTYINYTLSFVSIGSPNWNNIIQLNIWDGNALFRYCELYSDTYYQIWDGSTLKYQGLINPDINDFIVAEPIITPTNNGWFYFIILMLTFGLALVGLKVGLLAFPSMVLGLYLVINNANYIDYILLYNIIILLSYMIDIIVLVKWRNG